MIWYFSLEADLFLTPSEEVLPINPQQKYQKIWLLSYSSVYLFVSKETTRKVCEREYLAILISHSSWKKRDLVDQGRHLDMGRAAIPHIESRAGLKWKFGFFEFHQVSGLVSVYHRAVIWAFTLMTRCSWAIYFHFFWTQTIRRCVFSFYTCTSVLRPKRWVYPYTYGLFDVRILHFVLFLPHYFSYVREGSKILGKEYLFLYSIGTLSLSLFFFA